MADEAKALIQDPPFPTPPATGDGTIMVQEDDTSTWFWNATAGQWQRVQKGGP